MKTKKLLSTLFLGIILFSKAQIVNIPDANFKAYLIATTAINTNGDSEIQISEANSFAGTINCANKTISNLAGIEAFINLKVLLCNDNNLTNLDLSSNTKLTRVKFGNNNLNYFNLKNGNNSNLTFDATPTWNTNTSSYSNSNLMCIQVDNATYSNANWSPIPQNAIFSENCATACTVIKNPVQLTDIGETFSTLKALEYGNFDIEYGLGVNYQQGSGGTTINNVSFTSENNTYVINNLQDGKAYTIYVRKVCNSNNKSIWRNIGIVNTIMTYNPVTNFPYIEDFDTTNDRGYTLEGRGWTPINLTPNTFNWKLYSGSMDKDLEPAIMDWAAAPVDRSMFSRAMQLSSSKKYTLRMDYYRYHFEGFNPNSGKTNFYLSTTTSDNGTLLSSIENITNPNPQTHTFEFTPPSTGIFYIRIQGQFAANPNTTYPNASGQNYLHLDNFKLEEGTLSVNDIINKEIIIYPNPVKDILNFSEEVSNIKISDMSGKVVKELTHTSKSINLSNLTKGNYIITTTTKEGKKNNQKIIKD